MGAINFSIRNYFDTIIEVVGIKTGLLLSRSEVVEILKEEYHEWFLEEENLDLHMRIRSEEMEYHIRYVRHKIGNLTEEMLNPFLWSNKLMKWYEKGINPVPVVEALATVSAKYPNQKVDPIVVIEEIRKLTKASHKLILDVVLMYADHQFQNSQITIPERKEWDGGTALEELFKCEVRTKDGKFLGQKFLDYLAVNGDKLKTIYWRNFERFCAEFFTRSGYRIELGPGQNDGGVDIRAYDENDAAKPLILIQCKRYAENKVDIETVKAFYADVLFENAQRGLIVTTSHVAKGGKKVSEVRKYPLSFAENEDVKKWASEMWRHSPNRQ